MSEQGTMRVKGGLAEMLKGGVIMDVVNAEQAKIAEDAGACAVMALERVPADIRAEFERRMIGATFANHRLDAATLQEVRRRFDAHLGAEGVRFEQPMRVNLLRRL